MSRMKLISMVALGACVPLAALVVTSGCSPALAEGEGGLAALVAGASERLGMTDDGLEAQIAPTAAGEAERADGDRPPHAPGGPRPLGPQLSLEQLEQIRALLEQLDAGVITEEEFCVALAEILGEPQCDPPLPPIGLTEEQIELAEQIFDGGRDEIFAAHELARDEVLGELTAEQQELLEVLLDEHQPPEPPLPPWAEICPPPDEPPCPRPVMVPLRPCPPLDDAPPPPGGQGGPSGGHGGFPGGQGEPGGPPGGPPADGERPRPPCLHDELIAELGLSEEQVEAIVAVHDELRWTVEAIREAAREEFRSILTEEQLELLDQLPPPPHHPPH